MYICTFFYILKTQGYSYYMLNKYLWSIYMKYIYIHISLWYSLSLTNMLIHFFFYSLLRYSRLRVIECKIIVLKTILNTYETNCFYSCLIKNWQVGSEFVLLIKLQQYLCICCWYLQNQQISCFFFTYLS